MRLHSRLNWFVALAMLAYAASPAGAQPAQPGSSPPAGGTPPAFDAQQGQVGFEGQVRVAPQDQLAQADAHITYAGQARDVVQRRLQSARQQRDVVKMLCLNDKLNQIDVANRTLQERQKAHASAVQRSDRELANHEFTIMGVVRKRVEQLTTEANQCIGLEAAFTGTTTTFTTVDPNLPATEDTAFPPEGPISTPAPPIEVGPPQPASPSK